MQTHEVDVVVVGMGPGGEDVAGSLASAGLSVVGVESHLVGGECPYYGCIPSKMIIRAADLLAEARRVNAMSGTAVVTPDYSIVADRIRDEATDDWDDTVAVDRFTGKGGTFVRGRGALDGAGRVRVGDDVYVATLGVVLATGTSPRAKVAILSQNDAFGESYVTAFKKAIEGTDISWMDLSLSFLWWPHARTVGGDEVRGRDCVVLDVPAPGADYAGIAGVRLWIDPKIPVMLRAVSYGLDGLASREVEVKAFKKINDRWVIQVIEVESQPSGHKTILRVRDVQDRNRKSFIKVDEGGPAAPADEIMDESVEPVTPVLLNDEGGMMKAE